MLRTDGKEASVQFLQNTRPSCNVGGLIFPLRRSLFKSQFPSILGHCRCLGRDGRVKVGKDEDEKAFGWLARDTYIVVLCRCTFFFPLFFSWKVAAQDSISFYY